MFNIFTKKKNKEVTKQNKIRGYIVPKHFVKEFKYKMFEPKKFEPEVHKFMMKYRDTKTGEVFEIDLYDHEAYNKMMSNKNAQILFK